MNAQIWMSQLKNDMSLKCAITLGARVFNNIALPKGEKTIQDNETTINPRKSVGLRGISAILVGLIADARMMQDQHGIQN